jgi:hypothetical protein
MPTADDIFGRPPTPAPWPATRPVLAIAAKLLSQIVDDRTADLIERLACAIGDQRVELDAVRSVLSAAVTLSHDQHVEIVRLRARLADLLDERRRERTAAA